MSKAIRIEVKGNSICTCCGARGWFVVSEDDSMTNPASAPIRYCPWCGSHFELVHVDDDAEIDDYERVNLR